MAAWSPVRDLCEEATCSVCLDYFKDPVIIPECGHNFCRACLTQCWGEPDTEASCPQCRETVQQKNFIPNRQLANFAEIVKKLSLQGGNKTGGEERVCEKHREPLKLFCKDHESCICVVCDKAKEHENHKVIPLEEAYEEYKDQICSLLQTLRKKEEKMLTCKSNIEEESQDLLEQTKAEKQKMRAEFRQLHQFLEEQEKRLLAQMEELEKEIAIRRDEHLATLSEELSSLASFIPEMEEKCQQPASELLQDVRRTLERCKKEEIFEEPVAFPSAVKWRIWDFSDINAFLEGVMKQFQDTLVSGLPLQKANVILDPDTANPWLITSEDPKRITWGEKRQALPKNPERFSCWPCVLGCEGFTAGRHSWEVTVGGEGGWALGVASKSVERKGRFELVPEEGIWAVGKLAGQYWALTSPEQTPLSLCGALKRVRLSLNCAVPRLTFSDADTAGPLYTFAGASFTRGTVWPFFYVEEKSLLTLSLCEAAMAAAGAVRDLCEEATCSVCLEYFTDPVIIPECGHNFCRACLTQYWREAQAFCPQCRETVQQRNFIPNRQLKSVVEIAKKLSLQGGNKTEGEERVCEKHREPLKLFCKDHESSICVVCDRSKEHENHKVIPLEEAYEEYKDQICSLLKTLRKKEEKMLTYKADIDKKSQDLLEQTKAEKQKTMAEFRQLHKFLEKQEKGLLAQMEKLEKEIAIKRDEHLATLSKELSCLASFIQEMEEKCQQPASELLQILNGMDEAVTSLLSTRCEKEEKTYEKKNPVAIPPALKWRIWDLSDISTFLEDVMKQFKDTLVSGPPLQKANVILDPDTAHPSLIVSEDRKSLTYGDKDQALPQNPERFDSCPCVLGCEGFTVGKHSWEVTVGGEGGWAVGVASKSVKRKGWFVLSPEEGIWAVGKCAGQCRALTPPVYPPLSLCGALKRLRVSLNCAGPRLTFSDADTAAPLYTFSGASFTRGTVWPFFYVDEKNATLSL
ncbi:uncharacterized protein LOC128343923 [Hemicordylus capensis]|uniref:uncharacterized protein LOC128343923 n=1 Tax=Hemicordylus capensis TaxID=884348 RepID=UPI002304222C|nr:uncharacterized protein LOC128343923 [Hemicordylus capensis]